MVVSVSTYAQSQILTRRMLEMQTEMYRLQNQLASEKKAEYFSELGSDARMSLSLQASRATIETRVSANAVTKIRMDAMQTALSRLAEIASELRDKARVATTAAGLSAEDGNAVLKATAASRLNEVMSILNTQVDGVHLFAGRRTDAAPMPDIGAVGTAGTPIDNVAQLDTDYTLDNTAASGTDRYAAIQKHLDSTAPAPPGWPPTAPTPASATDPYYYQGETGPNAALSATIDQGLTIEYGINGTDASVQALLRGLYALATTDLNPTTENGFRALADLAADDLDTAFNGFNQEQGDLGVKQAILADVTTRQNDSLLMLERQIGEIEAPNMAEVISRLETMKTNLDASYRILAGLQDLSLAKLL